MKDCEKCGATKKENAFIGEVCRKCYNKMEKERAIKLDLFDPDQHRQEWYATYGKQSPISPNKKIKVEYARFIPRSKTQKL